MENAKHYQDLTFAILSKMMEKEANEGRSYLVLPFGIQAPMLDILKEKGFKVENKKLGLTGSNEYCKIKW